MLLPSSSSKRWKRPSRKRSMFCLSFKGQNQGGKKPFRNKNYVLSAVWKEKNWLQTVSLTLLLELLLDIYYLGTCRGLGSFFVLNVDLAVLTRKKQARFIIILWNSRDKKIGQIKCYEEYKHFPIHKCTSPSLISKMEASWFFAERQSTSKDIKVYSSHQLFPHTVICRHMTVEMSLSLICAKNLKQINELQGVGKVSHSVFIHLNKY